MENATLFETDILETIIRNNLSCHHNKILSDELIKLITKQIIDSISYSLGERKNDE